MLGDSIFVLQHLLPLALQSLLLNHPHQWLPIPLITKAYQHPADVAQMLARTTFTAELQLAHNDVFRRSESDFFPFKIRFDDMSNAPGMQFIFPAEVDVSFVASLVVDEFEVTP